MKIVMKRLCLLMLCAVMLAGTVIFAAPDAQAAESVCYRDYTTISAIKNYSSYGSMQGFTCDGTYTYCAKINSGETGTAFFRTSISDGTTVNMTDTSGNYVFTGLGHSNDMEAVVIDGVTHLFVATTRNDSYGIVRYTVSGSTLTQVANYGVTLDGSAYKLGGIAITHIDADKITFLFKLNKYFYTGSISASATSGTIAMKEAFTLDVADVMVDGVSMDLSSYLHQGFGYYDNKVFVPMTGGDAAPNLSAIAIYNIEGAYGTIKSDRNLSVFFTSKAYPDLCEVESCAINPNDGRLYFSTNRRVSSSDSNHDAVHYVKNYIYDPSHDDQPSTGNFRWETVNDKLMSVTDGGNSFNSATMYAGTLSGGTFTDAQYSLDKTVKLNHDAPWVVEWQSEGAWTTGSLLFSESHSSLCTGNRFFFRRNNSTLMAFGEYSGTQFNNYGLALSDYGIDGAAAHVYRLTNKIASDGSNMVYLSVDGKELGAMNNYYVAGKSQGTTSNWLSGKDFEFSYFGTKQHPVEFCSIGYIQVWSNGIPSEQTSNVYRWETVDNAMTNVTGSGKTANGATKLVGSCTDGVYSKSQYALAQDIMLRHDLPWEVQWQSEGNFTGGAMLLGAGAHSKTNYAPYILRAAGSGFLGMGMYDNGKFYNYGLKLSDYGIDGTVSHVYTLTNKISDDGSNMVYLSVDGTELGALNQYYIGGTAQGTTSNWVSGKDFAFTYMGSYEHSINECSVGYIQVNEGCAHTYAAVVTAPTCTAAGYTTYTCSICGDSYVADEVAATGHDYEAVTVDPTCTEPGSTTYTCACGDSYSEEIPAIGHNYEAVVTAPTCEDAGYTTYTCANCGDSYVADEVSATGHSYKGTVTAPTCTAEGYTIYTCSECASSYVGDQVAATGHDYEVTVVDPTCTESGSTTYTCGCGDTYTEVIFSPGHSYKAVVTAPTCTDAGYTTYTCANCGDSYVADEVAATGHNYENGTCTACGGAEPAVVPTIKLNRGSATFEDEVYVSIYCTITDVEDIVNVGLLVSADDVVDETDTYITEYDYKCTDSTYVVRSHGIPAKKLNELIYFKVYALLSDGTYAYSRQYHYSPEVYALDRLVNSTDANLKALCVAMLNYGAAAQTYFGYNTEDLANADLTDAQKALVESYAESMVTPVTAADAAKIGEFANTKGYSSRKPSVSFEGAFSISYYLTPNNAPVNGVTLYYWTKETYDSVDVLTRENADGIITTELTAGVYKGTVAGIAAKEIDQPIYAAGIYEYDGVTYATGVMVYSLGAYCVDRITNGSAEMKPLAEATAVYGYYAKQYFSA